MQLNYGSGEEGGSWSTQLPLEAQLTTATGNK